MAFFFFLGTNGGSPPIFAPGAGDVRALDKRITNHMRDLLKFTPKLEFVEAGSLARSTHKGQLIEKLYEP